MDIKSQARAAKEAAAKMRASSAQQRTSALLALADALELHSAMILEANALDIAAANKSGLDSAMVDRLMLDQNRIAGMAASVRSIAEQPEVVGAIVSEHVRPDGLRVSRKRVPLGVIAMIFESRPNVVVDCSALAIKSGNGILLKGGKEAKFSNAALAEIVRAAIKAHVPEGVVSLLDSTDRQSTQTMLTLKDEIDVVIPRGGKGLIEMVYNTALMPVIAHFEGLCHIYVHKDADQKNAEAICINAKVQRPGVCNAVETILVHKDLQADFLPRLVDRLRSEGVTIRGCAITQKIQGVETATEVDWATEYLAKIVSIKVVEDLDQAISHIQRYGTHHTEAILSSNPDAIDRFEREIDASCIAVNASTRFNDGGELGLGAELGIATTRFHAYGPMGAAEMTTQHFVVTGHGHIRT